MSDAELRAKEIFFKALEQSSPGAMSKYIDKACGDDAQLRERVEQLLRAHQEAGNFLGGEGGTDPTVNPPVEGEIDPTVDHPVEVGIQQTVDHLVAEGPGMQIGPYRLLQVIGEGGMGVVYMADQTKPVSRRVALKIIKPGMDSKQVIARFEAERQALAMMEHPNIARVLDAGTTDSGRPYFVMELVKGIPITEYSDKHRLSPKERLNLMVPICQAVQHAHQKGIIHRDLKPNNILVAQYDDKAVPKIIDFGVAKAVSQQLTEKTLFTQYGQIVGTIDYMSPEQATFNQLDVDTRTDIYSLGVVLYELLAGERPFDRKRLHSAAFDELLRIIREEEPPRPSVRLSSSSARPTIAANRKTESKKLSLLMRGELDWIVMKALEKDRSRRYETSNGLSRDIQRYLHDEPVVACPPSATYRLKKFVRRNKSIVATITAIAIALVLGIVGTTLQTFRAHSERDRAVAAEDELKDKISEVQRAKEETEEALVQKNQAFTDAIRAKDAEQTAKKEALWNLYVARLFPMKAAWEQRNLGELEQLLDDSRPNEGEPDFRGWEWYYFQDQCRQVSRLLEGESLFGKVDWCTKTGKIAVAMGNRTIEIRDASGQSVVRALPTQTDWIGDLAWSPDGENLAFTHGKWFSIWTVDSNRSPHRWESGHDVTRNLAWSWDGKKLATSGNDSSGEIRIWDTENWDLLQTLNASTPSNVSYVRDIDWHPDNIRLATAHRFGELVVWNTDSKERILQKNVSDDSSPLDTVAWSPDGELIAVGHVYGLTILNDNWRKIASAKGNVQSGAVRWNSDGSSLACGGNGQTIVIWNRHNKDSREYSLHGKPIHSMAWSPDGNQILVAGQGVARLLSIGKKHSAAFVHYIGKDITPRNDVHWSPDGSMLLCTHFRGTAFCDPATGEVLRAFPSYNMWGSAWHPNSQMACTLSYSGRLYVWDVSDIKNITLKRVVNLGRDANTQAKFSPDGKQIAIAGNNDGQTMIWAAANWQPTEQLNDRSRWNVAWSPCGKFLATSTSNITVWDMHMRTRLFTRGGVDATADVVWSPDARIITTVGSHGHINIVRAMDGKMILKINAHKGPISAISWEPRARRFATSGFDGNVVIWDGATGTKLLTLPCGSPVRHVAWSPDSRRMACLCEDGTLRIWGSTEIALPTDDATYVETGVLASVKSPEEEFAQQEYELTTAVQARPNDPAVWLARGKFYRLHQRWAKAAADFDQYLERADNEWDRMKAAQTHLMAGNRDAYLGHCRAVDQVVNLAPRICSLLPRATNDLDRILQVAEQNAKANADKWDLVYQPGAVLYRMGRYADALKTLQEVTLPPGEIPRAMIHLWLALTYHQLDEDRLAISHLDEAMGVALPSPTQVLKDWEVTNAIEFRFLLREAKGLIRGNEEETRSKPKPPDEFERFNDELMHPDGPVHQIGLAEVHVIGGHYSDARACLNTALEQLSQLAETYPDQASRIRAHQSKALAMLGKIDLLKEDFEAAVETYRRAVKIYPSVTHRFELARALAASGEADDAQPEFRYVLKVFSKSANSLNSFAWALVADPNEKLWRASVAVEFAGKAVELSPKQGLYWNTLGVALYRDGDFEKAIESLTKSEELLQGEQYSFNGFFLAMAHWQLGNKHEAKDFYDESVKWMDANEPLNKELIRFKDEAIATRRILNAHCRPGVRPAYGAETTLSGPL